MNADTLYDTLKDNPAITVTFTITLGDVNVLAVTNIPDMIKLHRQGFMGAEPSDKEVFVDMMARADVTIYNGGMPCSYSSN